METLVVVGGSAAGMAAAAKAKRMNKNLNVIVFERSNYVSYAPCGIPYYFEGLVESIDDLVYYTAEYFRKERGIDVRNRHLVTEIDRSGKTVTAVNLDTEEEVKVNYDKLILATGGISAKPPIDGIDLAGIHTLRILEDGERLYEESKKAEVVGIVGAGYIGLEMAEAFKTMGKKVILLEMLDHVMPAFDPEPAKPIEEELIKNSIELHLNEKVVAFDGKDRVREIITEKDSYKVDVVLLSIGVKPNVEFARKLELEIGVTGGVKVDRRMRTSDPEIYAAGDNVETINLVTGKPTYAPLAPAANKMGRVAGENVAGGNAEFPGVVGTAITKVFELEVGRSGLTYKQAVEEGFNAVYVDITHGSRSHYYPGGSKLNLRLVADKDSHKVLGLQITGREGVLAKVDTIAAVLTAGLKTEDLKMLDLAYAPPFAPVWDALTVAGSVIERKYR